MTVLVLEGLLCRATLKACAVFHQTSNIKHQDLVAKAPQHSKQLDSLVGRQLRVTTSIPLGTIDCVAHDPLAQPHTTTVHASYVILCELTHPRVGLDLEKRRDWI